MDESDMVDIGKITIEYKLAPDGEPVFSAVFETADGHLMPMIEGLGLLEAAKDDLKWQHDAGSED